MAGAASGRSRFKAESRAVVKESVASREWRFPAAPADLRSEVSRGSGCDRKPCCVLSSRLLTSFVGGANNFHMFHSMDLHVTSLYHPGFDALACKRLPGHHLHTQAVVRYIDDNYPAFRGTHHPYAKERRRSAHNSNGC